MARKLSTVRFEARVPAKIRALLERAAEIRVRTLTEFVVAAAHDAAHRTIEEAEVVRVSAEDHRLLAQALLKPRQPTAALRRAPTSPIFARRE